MRFLGRFFKYLLRSAFSIIIFLLFIGWAKTDWNMGAYIDFLNTTTWSVFDWSQPATWVDPFFPSPLSGDISDLLSSHPIVPTLGLDMVDPTFGADASDTEVEYGFTATGQTADTTTYSGSIPKTDLIDLIKKSINN